MKVITISRAQHFDNFGHKSISSFIVIMIIIIIILVFYFNNCAKVDKYIPLNSCGRDLIYKKNPHKFAFDYKMHSTIDVDPLVTGQLYENREYMKNTYSSRDYDLESVDDIVWDDVNACHRRKYGNPPLSEFKSDGSILVEPIHSFVDDGIPKQWRLPSTPIKWHKACGEDYYGIEGPMVYTDGLYTLTEPDHLPLVS
jgi:hypothetical protein